MGWDRETSQLGSHGLSWLNSPRSRLLEQNQKCHLFSVTCFVFLARQIDAEKKKKHTESDKNQEELSMYVCVHTYISHLYMFMYDCVCMHLWVMINVIICYFTQERVKMYILLVANFAHTYTHTSVLGALKQRTCFSFLNWNQDNLVKIVLQ